MAAIKMTTVAMGAVELELALVAAHGRVPRAVELEPEQVEGEITALALAVKGGLAEHNLRVRPAVDLDVARVQIQGMVMHRSNRSSRIRMILMRIWTTCFWTTGSSQVSGCL